jgi:hypothetical protein
MSDEFNEWHFTYYNMDEIKLQNHVDHKLTCLWNWWHYIIIPHRWIHVHKIYHKDEIQFKHKNHNIYEVVKMDVEILCLMWNSIIVLEFHNMDENMHLKNNNLYISFEVYKFTNSPSTSSTSFFLYQVNLHVPFFGTYIFRCLRSEISFNLCICYYCKRFVINNIAQKQKWKLENCPHRYPWTLFFKYDFNFILVRMLVIFLNVVQKNCLESILEPHWTFRFVV